MNKEEMLSKLKEFSAQLPEYGVGKDIYATQAESLIDLYDERNEIQKELDETKKRFDDPKSYEAPYLVLEQAKLPIQREIDTIKSLMKYNDSLNDILTKYRTEEDITPEIRNNYNSNLNVLRTQIKEANEKLSSGDTRLDNDQLTSMLADANNRLANVTVRNDDKYNRDQARIELLQKKLDSSNAKEVFLTYDYSKELNSVINDLENNKIDEVQASKIMSEFKSLLPKEFIDEINTKKAENIKNVEIEEQQLNTEIAALTTKLSDNGNYIFGKNPNNTLALQNYKELCDRTSDEIADDENRINEYNDKIDSYKASIESTKNHIEYLKGDPSATDEIASLEESIKLSNESIQSLIVGKSCVNNKLVSDRKILDKNKSNLDIYSSKIENPNVVDERLLKEDKEKLASMNESLEKLKAEKAKYNNDVLTQLDAIINANPVKSADFKPDMKTKGVLGQLTSPDGQKMNIVYDELSKEDDTPTADAKMSATSNNVDVENKDEQKSPVVNEVPSKEPEQLDVVDIALAPQDLRSKGKALLGKIKNYFSKMSKKKKTLIKGVTLFLGGVILTTALKLCNGKEANDASKYTNPNLNNNTTSEQTIDELKQLENETDNYDDLENDEDNKTKLGEEYNGETQPEDTSSISNDGGSSYSGSGSNSTSESGSSSSEVISSTEEVISDTGSEQEQVPTELPPVHEQEIDENAGKGLDVGQETETITGGEEIKTEEKVDSVDEVKPNDNLNQAPTNSDKNDEHTPVNSEKKEEQAPVESEKKDSPVAPVSNNKDDNSIEEIISDEVVLPDGYDENSIITTEESTEPTIQEDVMKQSLSEKKQDAQLDHSEENVAKPNPQVPGPVTKPSDDTKPSIDESKATSDNSIDALISEEELNQLQNTNTKGGM